MSSSFCHITAAASSESEPSDTHGETSTTRKDSRQQQAAYLCNAYNQCPPDDHTERYQILSKLLKCPSSVQIEPVFSVRNGGHCIIGKGTFINHNVTFIDTQSIILGNQVLIGPNTVITTMASQPGAKDKPVHIGHRVWIGANVTITAGVTIGDNAVIGAGSVVESDIPANAIAVGQPARVIRKIQQNTQ